MEPILQRTPGSEDPPVKSQTSATNFISNHESALPKQETAVPIHETPIQELDASTDSLRAKLQTLSQEIFDMIYTEVFTAAPGMRNVAGLHDPNGVQKHREALKLLHVCSDSRALYAKSYYGPGAHFIFAHNSERIAKHNSEAVYKTWDKSLPSSSPQIPARITLLQRRPTQRIICCLRHSFCVSGGPRATRAERKYWDQMSAEEQAELKELGVVFD